MNFSDDNPNEHNTARRNIEIMDISRSQCDNSSAELIARWEGSLDTNPECDARGFVVIAVRYCDIHADGFSFLLNWLTKSQDYKMARHTVILILHKCNQVKKSD